MKDLVKRKVLYPIYNIFFNKKYRDKESKIFLELKKLENLNIVEISHLQNEKLLDILQYAYKNTIYYKKIFDDNNINLNSIQDLKKIPFLTKELIKNNLDTMISKEYPKKKLRKRNTGGSTGKPLEFYSDTMAGRIDNAHHWYLYSLMGYKKGDVIISASGKNISQAIRNKNIFWVDEGKNNVWGECIFSVLYLNEFNIQYYIEHILSLKPAILRGYPSFFDTIAKHIILNKIEIPFNIKGINLTSEMCSTQQRINIELAFSTMIYFEYGHTEISLYCYTKDATYEYESSPIYGYIEVLDDDGNDVNIGEIGNIFVTGFNNHGMPFIRYETGDLGELSYRNSGHIHFSKILGRNQDYIISKNNQKVFLTALIFGQHLKAFKNIVQWQLEQNLAGKVNIKIIKRATYTIADELDIIENFRNATDVDIEFIYVDLINMTKAGKHLFLIQNIK